MDGINSAKSDENPPIVNRKSSAAIISLNNFMKSKIDTRDLYSKGIPRPNRPRLESSDKISRKNTVGS